MHNTHPQAETLTRALLYRDAGLPVFPVCYPLKRGCFQHGPNCNNPGKVPLVKWKTYQTELPTAADVEYWFGRGNANIGMATGALAGVCVVDIDSPDAMRLAESYGLRPGPRVATGRIGGYHLWHAYRDDAPTVFAKADGIDFRGQGGYVLLPPSKHELGRAYAWDGPPYQRGDDLPPLPRWIDALAAERVPANGHANGTPMRQGEPIDLEYLMTHGIDQGARDDTITRVARRLRADGVEYPEALGIVQAIAANCRPPFDARLAEAKLESAWRKFEPNPPPVPHLGGKRKTPPEVEEPEEERLLEPIPSVPIEVLPAAQRTMLEASTLPSAFLAGAGLAALASAIGGQAIIQFGAKLERAALWIPLVGQPGAGKSPSISLMFDPLRRADDAEQKRYEAERAEYEADQERKKADPNYQANYPKPRPPLYRLLDDATPEALWVMLAEGGSRALVLDELKQLLGGFGEYKGRADPDVARLLKVWTGQPIVYSRKGNVGVTLRIPRPTLVLCGALVSADQALLGEETDGLRTRWLLHLAPLQPAAEHVDPDEATREVWAEALGRLKRRSGEARTWLVTGRAYQAMQALIASWAARQAHAGPVERGMLAKADTTVLRLALVLDEADALDVGEGPRTTVGAIERAAAYFEYSLACARALPAGKGATFGRVAERADPVVERLTAWLDNHEDWVEARLVLKNQVGGIRTSADLKVTIQRFEAIYPGAVRHEKPPTGGRTKTWVRTPRRAKK